MPGHSRSKNGVASLAYVPGIHVFFTPRHKDMDGRNKSGHDDGGLLRRVRRSLHDPHQIGHDAV